MGSSKGGLSLRGEVFLKKVKKGRKRTKRKDYQTHHNQNFRSWNEGEVKKWLLLLRRGKGGV